ncbi:MAG: hypothetical protein H0W53_17775 [Acidobacteria bacterium]|nr:hypothetical protein [Acidobacteriota bacterium]
MAKALEAEIDKLFQLPPADFTAARNALAKAAGPQAAAIKALTKPPIAAWAVNRLYWKDSERYEALIDAANQMRKTHRAVIEGRKADLRSSGREHELALDAALKSTMALLKDAGQPATDATKHAVLNTLRALPSDEPAGRLTKTLAPGGFEMLAGVTPAAAPRRRTETLPPAKDASRSAKGKAADPQAEREEARAAAKAREARAAAERALRDAEQRARQAEFEAARATRDATKAEGRLEEARRDLDAAQEAFTEAEAETKKAVRSRETAERHLVEAQAAVETARART